MRIHRRDEVGESALGGLPRQAHDLVELLVPGVRPERDEELAVIHQRLAVVRAVGQHLLSRSQPLPDGLEARRVRERSGRCLVQIARREGEREHDGNTERCSDRQSPPERATLDDLRQGRAEATEADRDHQEQRKLVVVVGHGVVRERGRVTEVGDAEPDAERPQPPGQDVPQTGAEQRDRTGRSKYVLAPAHVERARYPKLRKDLGVHLVGNPDQRVHDRRQCRQREEHGQSRQPAAVEERATLPGRHDVYGRDEEQERSRFGEAGQRTDEGGDRKTASAQDVASHCVPDHRRERQQDQRLRLETLAHCHAERRQQDVRQPEQRARPVRKPANGAE